MSDIQKMIEAIQVFRDAREWGQFHTPKDMALSLLLEAGELAEHFQWKDDGACREHVAAARTELGHELADVLYWVLLMSHDFGIDITAAFGQKMALNAAKYPVAAARGKHTKYTELDP